MFGLYLLGLSLASLILPPLLCPLTSIPASVPFPLLLYSHSMPSGGEGTVAASCTFAL